MQQQATRPKAGRASGKGKSDRFFERPITGAIKIHHQFRIAVADCPNACSKPQIRDIGIIGAGEPVLTDAPYSLCESCVQTCREKAIVVNFWSSTWGKENSAIDLKTKLLLSLANGVSAGSLRQATRELVKAYALSVSVAELDELFFMFVWNGGVGTFASEIGPSSLFGAYQLIKTLENKGRTREEVMSELLENFGEKNPEVNVMPKMAKGT